MTSTFVKLAKLKLEQKPKPEKKEKRKVPLKEERKSVPGKSNEVPEVEKKVKDFPKKYQVYRNGYRFCSWYIVLLV